MRTQEVEDALRFRAHSWASEVLAAEVERLEELNIVRLAAISTATFQNTLRSSADRIPKDNPYWTIAYGDVCTAVDREIAQRVRAEAAEARVAELEAVRQDLLGKIVGWQDGARADHARIAELEAQNARLREALEDIEKERPVLYDMNTLLRFAGIAGDIAKATLADGKASP